jgi:hypothetical protein
VDKEDRGTIQHISDTLDEMLAVIKTPPNRFERIINIIAAIVGTVTIIGVIDIIRNWFFGG